MPSSPSISAAAAGPDRCSRAGTISMLRRGCRRMDAGSHGWPGIIPTCRGTARGSTSARWLKMAQSASPSQSPAERRNRSSNRNGRPTARRSCSCPIAPAGGIFIRLISQREPCGRWRRWRRSSDCRNGCLACRPTLSPGRSGSSAPIPKGGLACPPGLILANETPPPLATPFTEFGSVRAAGDRAVFRAGAPDHPPSIVALDLASGRQSVLKKATDILDRTDLRLGDYLTRVERVEFPTTGAETAFGLFYSPCNPDYAPGAEERPPLVVKCHGGPTSAASSTLNLGRPGWTSRRIAVLDVNYRGSTGFCRTYRDR